MATSPDYVRLAASALRPLADDVFDALRDAVIVVDSRFNQLPLILANATARRCFVAHSGPANSEPASLIDSSLYSLLGPATATTVEAALGSHMSGRPAPSRVLTWRFPRGEMPVLTEIKVLDSASPRRLIMFTFCEPSPEPLAEPRILSTLEQMPLDLLILDRELLVTYANAGAVRAAGSSSAEVLRFSALTLAPTSALARDVFDRALAGHHFHDDAVALRLPGEPTRWFKLDVQPLTDASGIMGLAVLSTEVSERWPVNRPGNDSDPRLRTLTQHASDIITIAGRHGNLHYVSGGIRNALGYLAEERQSGSLFEHIHPDDVAAFQLQYAELVDGKIGNLSMHYRARHKDGSLRWLESTLVSAFDNPLIKGVVINTRDVTKRRLAEHRLAQREEVFRLAAEAVNGILFEWDFETNRVHRSSGVYEVLGIQPAEVAELGAWSARIHPEDRDGFDEKIVDTLKAGRSWTMTYRIRDARGRYRSVLERGLVQRSADGVPLRAIGCAVDVSEIKRLTDLLGETQRAAKMGAWEYSYANRELVWTDEMYRIYETRREEFAVSWGAMVEQCTPESGRRLNDAIARAQAGDDALDLELEILTLKNNGVWVRLIGQVEKVDGRPFRAFGSVQNIQSQTLSKRALENNTDWLKLSMNMAHMHAWRWNRATDTLEFAIVDGQMVNLPRVFPGLKKLMARIHPNDRAAIRRSIDEAMLHHTDVQKEFRLKSHGGQYHAYATVARPMFDSAKQPIGLVGVTQDVTSRHVAEARLRRSEELLRTTTANTADTLILVDTELRVRFINRGAGGATIDDIVGRDLCVLLPPEACESTVSKLHEVLATGEPATYEFSLDQAGAATGYFENHAVLVRDRGAVTGISITMRNITERKRLEQEILDVSSRERQSIGRDLHDGLGQELTGVALMLRALSTRIHRNLPESSEQVDEIVALVNQSIESARSLARGLMPLNTDGDGFSLALRALADRSRELYGLKVRYRAEVSPEINLSETVASHLYRIAQEALTNTARHGQASAVEMLLFITKHKFLLRITDDGVGIGTIAGSGSGMGLKIMKYRAETIGAKFDILPHQPRGTVVRVMGQQPMPLPVAQSADAI